MADRLYFQFPLIKPYVQFSRIRLSNHLLPEAFAPAWPSGIVSSKVPKAIGVYSITAISFPSLLRKHDEGIAPSLSQSYVVFEIVAVLLATPTPVPTQWNFVSFYLPVALDRHPHGSPVFILIWLPLRITPDTPRVHLSVMVVFVKINVPVFPFTGQGRQLWPAFSRLHIGSLQLRPAGLLDSLSEPLSGNSAL